MATKELTIGLPMTGGEHEVGVDGDHGPLGLKPTLVLYNIPVLVTKHAAKKVTDFDLRPPQTAGDFLNSRKEVEDILNHILPPRCWEEDGQLWQQNISSNPATRQDVINLQEMLDSRMQQTQARQSGICPIRRELYTQCFDEIIRQVTINCSERGLLLLRIRDEVAMSIEAYETLYCSSVAFGMRKALQAHEEKELLRERANILETEKQALEDIIQEMKYNSEEGDRRTAELRAAEERKYLEEVSFLKKTNTQLKAQLEGIIAPKK